MVINNWNEYIENTSKTAVYEGADGKNCNGIFYAVMGFADEAYELFDSLGSEKKLDEFGDLLYYFARVIKEYGLSIEDIEKEAADLKEQMKVFRIDDAMHQVFSSACKINGITKKYLRDEDFQNSKPSAEKKSRVQFNLAYALVGIYNLCNFFKVDWREVASKNLEKLFSRKERNVLHGSGDYR